MAKYRGPEYGHLPMQDVIEIKRKKRMAAIDSLPPAIRELIHEYGLSTVKTLMDLGISNPKHIKHVVETILNEFSPTRGSYSQQGIRTKIDD